MDNKQTEYSKSPLKREDAHSISRDINDLSTKQWFASVKTNKP
jgi:hypothetical protein